MIKAYKLSAISLSSLLLTGCVNLAPDYERPGLPVPVTLPASGEVQANADLIQWQDVFTSPELVELTRLALDENRDLRIAAANVEFARAQYGIASSARFPLVSASGSATFAGDDSSSGSSAFRDSAVAQMGTSAYELDFFGRVRNLTDSALQSYLSTVEGERAARISIAASVAELWLRLAADRELLALAEETARTQSDSLDLTNELFRAGISNELDVRRASSSVETARAQAATFRAQVLQDVNALRLVVGTDLPPNIDAVASLSPSVIKTDIIGGVPSSVLLNRPDVIAAERQLLAANADIGVARAAMFPNISLTGSIGVTSSDFQDLIDSGMSFYSVGPQISLPIFDAGARRNQVAASKAARDSAVAQYEQAIQVAFRETADALAVSQTISARLEALEQLTEDSEVTLRLSSERFHVGVDDYLSVLDAQRATFDARQQLILARLDQALNQVALYRALGATP